MNKRIRILLIVLAGVLGVGCLAILVRPWEPLYHWKPLSSWLKDLDSEDPLTQQEVSTALREIGTNALPALIELLGANDTDSASGRRARAVLAFDALGTTGRAAIPQLAGLLHRGQAAQEVATILSSMGPDGLAPLAHALTNEQAGVRSAAAFALGKLRGDAQPAIPALIRTASDQDPTVRPNAIWSLGTIGLEPSSVVPALAERLGDTNVAVRLFALKALRKYGVQARPAVPAVLKALQDSNHEVRGTAGYALWIIDRAAASQAGVR